MRKSAALSLAALTSALLLASPASFAKHHHHHHHRAHHTYKDQVSYKGQARYKDEQPCPQPLVLHDGFYVGGQASYDSYRTRVTTADTLVGAGGVPVLSAAGTAALASNGWGGGIFAGYGMYFANLYYLAAEAFFNGTSANQGYSGIVTPAAGFSAGENASISPGMSWGVSALPGLKFNDSTLGYLRLGYAQSKIHVRTAFDIVTPAGVLGSFGANKYQWKGGFNYGLGLESAVYPHLSVRTEYSHTSFGSFSTAGASINPSDNRFTLGVIYHIM